MKPEKWADVFGYKGIYHVSTYGRVKRVAGCSGTWVGRILSPFIDRGGYCVVTLCKDCCHRKRFVHRLVLESFIGQYPKGYECRHLDGNSRNNRLDNLQI